MKMIRLAAALCLALLFASIGALAQQGSGQQSSGTPMIGIAINRSTLNSSAVITTGNTFQTVLSSIIGLSTQRQSLTIANNNATDSCWIFIGATASATKGTSILLLAGGSYARYWPYVPSDNIAATCASNSDTLYVDTQ